MNFKLWLESTYDFKHHYSGDLWKVEVNPSPTILDNIIKRETARGFADQNKNIFIWKERDAIHQEALDKINKERESLSQFPLTMMVPFYVSYTPQYGNNPRKLFVSFSDYEEMPVKPDNFEKYLRNCQKFLNMINYSNLTHNPFKPMQPKNISIYDPDEIGPK